MQYLTKENLSKFVTPAISGIVLGLIIGLIVNTDWSSPKEPIATKTGVANSTVTADTTGLVTPTLAVVYNTTVDATAAITVSAQKAGFAVHVDAVKAALPTWIAVREVVGTATGNILGAGLVQGDTEHITIDLLRETNADLQYQVYLYQDDGDRIFDFTRDLLIVKDRNPLSAGFIAQ